MQLFLPNSHQIYLAYFFSLIKYSFIKNATENLNKKGTVIELATEPQVRSLKLCIGKLFSVYCSFKFYFANSDETFNWKCVSSAPDFNVVCAQKSDYIKILF